MTLTPRDQLLVNVGRELANQARQFMTGSDFTYEEALAELAIEVEVALGDAPHEGDDTRTSIISLALIQDHVGDLDDAELLRRARALEGTAEPDTTE